MFPHPSSCVDNCPSSKRGYFRFIGWQITDSTLSNGKVVVKNTFCFVFLLFVNYLLVCIAWVGKHAPHYCSCPLSQVSGPIIAVLFIIVGSERTRKGFIQSILSDVKGCLLRVSLSIECQEI